MNSDLFGEAATPQTDAKEAMRFDWINLFVREKFGAPPDWRWFQWSRKEFDKPHEYMLVSGAVCTAKIERGKHKGQDNWKLRDKNTEATHVIRRTEMDAFQREWQARTGLCFECYGTGDKWAGWSAKDGNRYRPCRHCGATGFAAMQSSQESAA